MYNLKDHFKNEKYISIIEKCYFAYVSKRKNNSIYYGGCNRDELKHIYSIIAFKYENSNDLEMCS